MVKKCYICTQIIILILILSLSGCSGNLSSGSEISKLIEKGYMQTSGSYQDGKLSIGFISEDHTDYILAECTMTEEEATGFFDINTFGKFDEDDSVYLSKTGDVKLTSLKDEMPDSKEMTEFLGQETSELEKAGYVHCGDFADKNGNKVPLYCNEKYTYQVYIEKKSKTIDKIYFYKFTDFTLVK